MYINFLLYIPYIYSSDQNEKKRSGESSITWFLVILFSHSIASNPEHIPHGTADMFECSMSSTHNSLWVRRKLMNLLLLQLKDCRAFCNQNEISSHFEYPLSLAQAHIPTSPTHRWLSIEIFVNRIRNAPLGILRPLAKIIVKNFTHATCQRHWYRKVLCARVCSQLLEYSRPKWKVLIRLLNGWPLVLVLYVFSTYLLPHIFI